MDSPNAGRIGTMPLYPNTFMIPSNLNFKLKADTVTDAPGRGPFLAELEGHVRVSRQTSQTRRQESTRRPLALSHLLIQPECAKWHRHFMARQSGHPAQEESGSAGQMS